jgi:hypothetical protein
LVGKLKEVFVVFARNGDFSLMGFLKDGVSQSAQPLHEHRGRLSPSGA